MLTTVSNPEGINKSPINFSKTKMMYSFPKSDRFPSSNTRSYCKKAFYDIPTQLYQSQRKASVGYGNKYDFTRRNQKTPGPGKYQIKRTLNQKRSYSFGLSRSKIAIRGKLPNKVNNVPGPFRYSVPSVTNPISYSFRIRTKSRQRDAVPGPGKYGVKPTINKTGIYHLSRYKNSCATRINKPQRLIKLKKTQNPAPWHYKDVDSMNKTGKYFLTRLKSSGCRTFGIADRNTLGLNLEKIHQDTCPGPGSYRLPSEFGHYKSSRVSTMRSKFASTMSKMSTERTKSIKASNFRPETRS